ncbi:MAG: SRPBCC family protein [Mycobacterium sp.]
MSKQYRYRVSRHVAADPDTVWNVVSDHAGMAEWTPFRRSVVERAGDPCPNGTGPRGHSTWWEGRRENRSSSRTTTATAVQAAIRVAVS